MLSVWSILHEAGETVKPGFSGKPARGANQEELRRGNEVAFRLRYNLRSVKNSKSPERFHPSGGGIQ
jgi:hypothetical protein